MKNKRLNRFLHLFLLSNVAIAHPLLQKSSEQSEFFVAHGAGTFELITTALVLSLLLPLTLYLLERTAGLWHGIFEQTFHALFVFFLLTLFLLPLTKKFLPESGTVVILLSILFAFAFTLLYHKSNSAFQTLTLLTPLALAAPILFLLQDSTRTLMAISKPPALHKVNSKTPVNILLFDELPLNSLLDQNGNIDDVRFPNFAELARGSNWYRNTTSCSSLTDIAVPAILTGTYPEESRLPVVQVYPENLFTLLGGSYELHIQEAITLLNPKRLETQGWDRTSVLWKDMTAVYLHQIVPGPLSESLPSITETWGNFWDEEEVVNRAHEFRTFMNEIPRYPHTSLHFSHIMLPHKPWVYLPSGREYRDYGSIGWGTSQTNRGIWLEDIEIVNQFHRRHLLQIGFLDRLLGEYVRNLKASGLYDASLLIVTSDHGIAFSPGESLRKPSRQTMQDILYVPLFVKLPGQQEGSINDAVVETVDILPTIADVLKTEVPWKVVGRSVLTPARRRARTRLRPANTPLKFRSDFDLESTTLQKRFAQLGSRTGFEAFFGFSPPEMDPSAPRRKVPEVAIHDADAYENVNLQSNFVPAYLAGVVDASTNSDPYTLQILVNGVTRAVTKTFPAKRGKTRFAALVAENSFRQGKNKIEVKVLD